MSATDVEALLDQAAQEADAKARKAEEAHLTGSDDHHSRNDKHDRHRNRSRDRDRDPDRRYRDADRDASKGSPGSANGSLKNRHRSRSREDDRHRSRRDRYRNSTDADNIRSGGDFYRGSGRHRPRSRSPDRNRYYRPEHRDYRDRNDYRARDKQRDRDSDRRGRDSDRKKSPKEDGGDKPPQLTEDERDRRTVFVQQLAARLRTKELSVFFGKLGPVNEAQIVKDRVSGRSKGVGYVEFKHEESVSLALQLTGQKLLGIPIIVQLTEAEKNRQVRAEGSGSGQTAVPFHRLYVGNIHFSITEDDIQNIFEPFGELEFVQLQRDEQGRSKGYGFVQYLKPDHAKEALEKMNGFDLAGRPIRVGLGNDKFTPESTQNLLSRFQGQQQGSAFSGAGGRGIQAGGSSNFDRAGGREEKGAGGASALDDTDVAGVNFSNYSRDALMRKLARTDEPEPATNGRSKQSAAPKAPAKPLPVQVNQASRCIVLRNMFDPAEEESKSGNTSWIQELEEDVRDECEDKYGHVVHIALDPNTQGDIYIKFDRVQGGENAIKGLNGRYFNHRMISAQPVVDAVYASLFSRSKAL